MFIFNTQLLMIGIDHWWDLMFTITSAIAAILVFSAATQGFFLVKNRWWETVILLLVTFSLFRPGFWMDTVYPPRERVEPVEITTIAGEKPAGARMRLIVEGETLEGNLVSKSLLLPLGDQASGEARLERAGLILRTEDDKVLVDEVVWDSFAQRSGIEMDWEIKAVEIPLEQPSKYWMFIPALLLLGGIILMQRRRRAKENLQVQFA
jgi:hypothetical protein